MDFTIESAFCLNPFADIADQICEEFDPFEEFKVDPSYRDEIITEAAGANKKNIFQKLWAMIKKAVAWIGARIKQLVNGIRKLIRGKAKSSNQICREVGIVAKHSIRYGHASENEPGMPQTAADNLEVNFIEGISADGLLINVDALVHTNAETEVAIKGKNIFGGGTRASQVIRLVLDPRPLDDYIVFFKRITNDMTVKNASAADIERIAAECKNFIGRPSAFQYAKNYVNDHVDKEHKFVRLSIKDLMDFQIKVDEMCKVAEDFDDVYKEININVGDKGPNAQLLEKHYMDILNELSWACVNLQGGLHAILNGMQGIYQLDPGYWESIETPEKLAEFVEAAMKSGMPGKYLVNNIYNISTEKIKGKANVDKPIMGFGRLTLLPDGPSIFKVAINRYGVRSNKNDFRVMDEIKGKPDLMAKFAATTGYYGDFTINVMEKVKAGKANEPSAGDAEKLGAEINNMLARHGIGFEIYDIKGDAFGTKNGQYVLLDYGYLHRRSYKPQQMKKGGAVT